MVLILSVATNQYNHCLQNNQQERSMESNCQTFAIFEQKQKLTFAIFRQKLGSNASCMSPPYQRCCGSLTSSFYVFWLWCLGWFSRSKSMLQRQNISLTITGIEVLLMFFCFSSLFGLQTIDFKNHCDATKFLLFICGTHTCYFDWFVFDFVNFFFQI